MNWEKLLSNRRIRMSEITDERNEFESDYGRIIYSPALRRMHDKTQVFPLTSDDNIHSRLTHSNEVMSLGYTFGLKLSRSKLIQEKTKKNEVDLLRMFPVLMQSICLIHDIGNAPFGHFAETIVSDYFKNLDTKENKSFYELGGHEKRDFLNYDGNAQGLRVLAKLQFLDSPTGLNLTYATLASYLKYPNYQEINSNEESILKKNGEVLKEYFIEKSKHGVFYSEKEYFNLIMTECGLKNGDRYLRHPICYLMEAADSIAYICMDMEDGFNIGLFDINYICDLFKLNESKTAQKIIEICNDELKTPNTKIVNIRIALISYFVDLAYRNFEKNLEKIEKGDYKVELIKEDEDGIYKLVEKVSIQKIFTSREINYLETTGYSVLTGLLDFYIKFVFHDDKKFRKRAVSLISKSIVESAIEENLIEICESKIEKELSEFQKDLESFSENEEQNNSIQKQLDLCREKEENFIALKSDYEILFKRQFVEVLSQQDRKQLLTVRQRIYKLVNPEFHDLNDYFKFRVILDFISGMTDQYALNHYQKISGQKI